MSFCHFVKNLRMSLRLSRLGRPPHPHPRAWAMVVQSPRCRFLRRACFCVCVHSFPLTAATGLPVPKSRTSEVDDLGCRSGGCRIVSFLHERASSSHDSLSPSLSNVRILFISGLSFAFRVAPYITLSVYVSSLCPLLHSLLCVCVSVCVCCLFVSLWFGFLACARFEGRSAGEACLCVCVCMRFALTLRRNTSVDRQLRAAFASLFRSRPATPSPHPST